MIQGSSDLADALLAHCPKLQRFDKLPGFLPELYCTILKGYGAQVQSANLMKLIGRNDGDSDFNLEAVVA